ncbi:MAG: hypothetical protein V3T30_06635, partial [Thermodesulfobacteriota bacterium]
RVFKAINPLLAGAIPDKAKVRTRFVETSLMPADGFIDPEDVVDILDDNEVNANLSVLLQTLRFEQDRALIRLRYPKKKKPDEEFAVAIPAELKKEALTERWGDIGLGGPENVLLMTAWRALDVKVMSSKFPANPKKKWEKLGDQ